MPDAELSVAFTGRLKHGDLLDACTQRGWSQADFARYMGWSVGKAGDVFNLKRAPTLTPDEERKLFDLTQKLPDDLWPDWARSPAWLDRDKRLTLTRKVTPAQLGDAGFYPRQLEAPDDAVARHEANADLNAVLATLTPRESLVLRFRFGLDGEEPLTLKEVADRMGVTVERVHQLEAKAFRKLRHPSRLRRLRPLYSGRMANRR